MSPEIPSVPPPARPPRLPFVWIGSVAVVVTIIAVLGIIWARDDAHTARNETAAARAEAMKAQADLETEKKTSLQMMEELNRLRNSAEPKPENPLPGLRLREATGREVLWTMRKQGGGEQHFARTFEASNGESFAWIFFMDDNNFHDSPWKGFHEGSYAERVNNVTIVCSGDTVWLSAPHAIVLPIEPKRYGGPRVTGVKFFDKSLSPSYGQPFILFQLVAIDNAKGPVSDDDIRAVMAKDPFAPVKPLPPIGASRKHTTRLTLVCMKADNKWWESNDPRKITTRPKEVSAFYRRVMQPWIGDRNDK